MKMYKEIVQLKSVEEIDSILNKYADDHFFTDQEIKSVEHKNKKKSLGARYLIKKSILDFLELKDEYPEIEIENAPDGKPFVTFREKVKERIDQMQIYHVSVSISHSGNYVSTLVVLEQDV